MKESLADIRGVLFDLDGTLIDSREAMLLSFRHAYDKHMGIVLPRDDAEFRHMVAMRVTESSAVYGGELGPEIASSYNRFYETEAYKTGRMFPGMRETLAELRRSGYALGVVTNKSASRVRADFAYLKMEAMMDVIVTTEDTVERKPHPAPLLKAAEKLNIEPRCLAYVGDFQGDMQAAHAADMVAVAVLWGGIYLIEQLLAEQPDFVVEKPEGLLKLFPGVASPARCGAEATEQQSGVR